MQEAAYIAWRDPRVQMIAQYLWHDERMAGGKRYTGWQSGLLTIDGEPKPALAHFDDPMWVDVRRNVIWGQIRPGTEHDVEVQMRPPGVEHRVADRPPACARPPTARGSSRRRSSSSPPTAPCTTAAGRPAR